MIPLLFCKSGNPEIERRYATHYVDAKRVSQLKEERAARLADQPSVSPDGSPDGGGASIS